MIVKNDTFDRTNTYLIMMPAEEVQKELFAQIKARTKTKLVDTISEILHLSQDAAYRRIRNEKLLNLDEIIILSQAFNLSIDNHISVASKTKVVPFHFPFVGLDFDFTAYLQSILQNLQLVKEAGGTIYYSAKDIPMFHCFQLPELTKFKLFYWLKTMLSRRDFVGVKYADYEPDAEQLAICKEIHEVYSKINSVEIWNYETIHGLTSQIAYYKTVGFMTGEEAELMLKSLTTLLEHLFTEAEMEHKSTIGKRSIQDSQNFRLFFNEVLAADNSIYAEMGDMKAAFMPHIILNYITTFDEDYCCYIKEVFESVMKKSTLISGVNEKDRSLFFNYIFDRINSSNV